MPITATKSKKSPYFFINEIDPVIANTLDKALSYYPEDYERTNAYINGIWDGRERLFKRSKTGSYYFPLGLVERVKTVIEAFGDTFSVDGIEEYDPPHDRGTAGLQWASNIQLRDYQQGALLALMSHPLGCGVVSLPTGAGKTVCALKYAQYRNSPFTVLVHRKELMTQWASEIKTHLGIPAGMIGDKLKNPEDIANVCMVQTLQRDHSLIPESDLLIADECHIVSAQTVYDVCMHSHARYRIGLSATARRSDHSEMKIWAACGTIVANITVPDLIDAGYIARPIFRFYRMNPVRISNPHEWPKVYREGIVANEQRNIIIVQNATELARSGRQVYIHVAHIDHGTYLKNKIERNVKETEFLNGKDTTKKRKQTIRDFKDGKIRVLISTLLKEGVDLPSLDALIYAAGYKSSVMTIQTIGRALRKTEDKDNAIIVDFIDSGNKMISLHSDERFRTYSETYGKYCELNIVNR